MDRKPPETAALSASLLDASKRLSTRTVFFHQAVAHHLGLHVTDHKCLDLVLEEGRVTAGRLAEWTGLTTGAITSVINRLEKAGFVRRVKDPLICGSFTSNPSSTVCSPFWTFLRRSAKRCRRFTPGIRPASFVSSSTMSNGRPRCWLTRRSGSGGRRDGAAAAHDSPQGQAPPVRKSKRPLLHRTVQQRPLSICEP